MYGVHVVLVISKERNGILALIRIVFFFDGKCNLNDVCLHEVSLNDIILDEVSPNVVSPCGQARPYPRAAGAPGLRRATRRGPAQEARAAPKNGHHSGSQLGRRQLRELYFKNTSHGRTPSVYSP